jgi:hypothetical protein
MRSGLNVNSRVRALRMLRRGEETRNIAVALGVPGCEIELLFRVQTFVSSPPKFTLLSEPRGKD